MVSASAQDFSKGGFTLPKGHIPMKNYLDHHGVLRTKSVSGRGFSTPLALALAAVSGQAATLTWDNDGAYANGANDGSGTWNTSLTNWRIDGISN